MRILIDEKIPYLRGVLEPHAEVRYLPGNRITRAELKNTDAMIIRTRTRCDRNLLEGSQVRFIGTATIGYDHIDTGYCEQAGIDWTNAPGCNSSSVAQYMLAVLLHLILTRNWNPGQLTMGVVGVGHVGSKVGRMAGDLGMKVILNDPPRERREGAGAFASLEELLQDADLVSLHVPLTESGRDKTRHMADKQFFSGMKKGAWLINTSRGEVAGTGDLVLAIETGQIAGAVLDVWEGEPEICRDLLQKAELATPHIAGYSADGKAKGASMVVQALAERFGLPLTNWHPPDLFAPPDPVIDPGPERKSRYELLQQAVRRTYDVLSDDSALREHPEAFEEFRNNYPPRREPEAYRVNLSEESAQLGAFLERFGFRVSIKAG